MQAARLATRLQRELRMLQTDPPPGGSAWPRDEVLSHWEAQIKGPEETVYERGIFRLDVRVPERYPFEPPNVRFRTPIYHPNIDTNGRICLDILNMPPKGAWKPSLNIPTILTSIGLLLAEPNPDDGLMGDIATEYKHHRASFDTKARKCTEQHAMENCFKDESHRKEALRADAEHGTSSEPKKEKTSRSSDTPFLSFGLGFSTERTEGRSSEILGLADRQSTAAMRGNGRGPASGIQKLNLNMKLSLDKGARILGREEITAISAKGNFPGGTAPAAAAQQTRVTSVVEMGLRQRTSMEHAQASDASSSAMGAVNIGIIGHWKHSVSVHNDEERGQIPSRSAKLSASELIDIRKLERPEGSLSSTAPSEEQEGRVLPNRLVAASCFESMTKSSSATGNGRFPCKHLSLSFSKPSRARNGSGRSEVEDHPVGGANRHVKSYSFDSPLAIQNVVANAPEASIQEVEAVPGPLDWQVEPMEAQKFSSKPTKRCRGECSEERFFEWGVHKPPREMTRRQCSNEGTTTTTVGSYGIQNKLVEFGACTSQEDAKGPDHRVLTKGFIKWKPARLGLAQLPVDKAKISRERGEVPSQSDGFLQPELISTFDVEDAHMSVVQDSSFALQSKAGGPSSESSKFFRRENEIAVTVAPQSQDPASGMVNVLGQVKKSSQLDSAALTILDGDSARAVSVTIQPQNLSNELVTTVRLKKKAAPVDPRALIVLDSESSDEEPSKVRSRLSLTRRKGLKCP